jgi:diacylglycerol O-acyltransferase
MRVSALAKRSQRLPTLSQGVIAAAPTRVATPTWGLPAARNRRISGCTGAKVTGVPATRGGQGVRATGPEQRRHDFCTRWRKAVLRLCQGESAMLRLSLGVLRRTLAGAPFGGARGRLRGFDITCFRSESPEDPNDVLAVFVFKGPVDHERVRRMVSEQLLSQPHFRQRVAQGRLGSLHWVDTEVVLSQHLHFSHLPPGAGRTELGDALASVLSSPVDLTQPLWSLHFFDGYAGDRSVLAARMEHTLGDGVALLRLLLDLAEGCAGEAAAVRVPSRSARQMPPPWSKASRTRWRRIVALPIMDVPALRGRASGPRAFALTERIPLERIRNVARREGATTNDVVLAAIAGALRRYLLAQGVPTDTLALTALLPVSLRLVKGETDASAAMNQFGFVYLELPVKLGDARARLRATMQAMAELKASADAAGSLLTSTVLTHFPAQIAAKANALLIAKAALLISHLPGPTERLTLAGHEVEELFFSAPGAGTPLTVSAFSYRGALQLAVRSAASVVQAPEEIVRAFEAEVGTLSGDVAAPGDGARAR